MSDKEQDEDLLETLLYVKTFPQYWGILI